MRAFHMAVIDCETTGFSHTDRIVEIAVVTLDPADGTILDEFDTLLDPERDIGAQHIHGISAAMVAGAPEFGDIAPMLVQRLHDTILVAHNAPFDMRFLGYEFARIGVAFDPGRPICTYRATGQKLAVACRDHDIALTLAHSALADARATAALARRVPSPNGTAPARVAGAGAGESLTVHTLRRNSGGQSISRLGRIVDRARYPDAADEALRLYLEALDHALDDFVVERAEQDILDELAATLGLTRERRRQAHRTYFQSLVLAARRDNVVTAAEHCLLTKVHAALALPACDLPAVDESAVGIASIPPGVGVCFTGEAFINGEPMARCQLENAARKVGCTLLKSVTKKHCGLLVGDPNSGSTKAKAARKFGIPILSAEHFLDYVASSTAFD